MTEPLTPEPTLENLLRTAWMQHTIATAFEHPPPHFPDEPGDDCEVCGFLSQQFDDTDGDPALPPNAELIAEATLSDRTYPSRATYDLHQEPDGTFRMDIKVTKIDLGERGWKAVVDEIHRTVSSAMSNLDDIWRRRPAVTVDVQRTVTERADGTEA